LRSTFEVVLLRERNHADAPMSNVLQLNCTPMYDGLRVELSNGDVYIGSTKDLRRRFGSHRNGDAASTRSHLPAGVPVSLFSVSLFSVSLFS